MAQNLERSLTNEPQNKRPSATGLASEVDKSFCFGSILIRIDLRRSVDMAQLVLPSMQTTHCAQPIRSTYLPGSWTLWCSMLTPGSFSRVLSCQVVCLDNSTMSGQGPFYGSFAYFFIKVTMVGATSGVTATLPARSGGGHSVRSQAWSSLSKLRRRWV